MVKAGKGVCGNASKVRKLKADRSLAGIRHTMKQHLPEIIRRYNVTSIGLFGSRVRGNYGKASDLDVLVEFSEPPSLFDFIELENYLSDLLGIEVDLVARSALKPRIGRHILSEVVNV